MKSEGGAKVLFVDIRTKGEFQFLGTPTVIDQNIPYMEIDDPTSWDKKTTATPCRRIRTLSAPSLPLRPT